MWKLVNGRLVQTADTTRAYFRTNISASILGQLKELAKTHNTHINYLLESGLANLLETGTITFNKETRPKDRIKYKTTYDSELLESVKGFAKANKLFINDVIEYSVQFIDIEDIKRADHRYRIEE